MICLSIALTRLPHLSHDDFTSHWREIHAPIIMTLANDLGIRRYLQIHRLDEDALAALGVRADAGFSWDGIAQVWYDDRTSALRVRDTDAGKAALSQIRQDEARFIARDKSILWWGEPHPILTGSEGDAP